MPEQLFHKAQEMHQIGAAIKYNPHLWGPEELRAIFVARKKELQQILDSIAKTEPQTIPQHILITGHRGMGKSTLLQRVALAIDEDVTLSQIWLPLRFPEEQYTVSTLAELWSNVLGALADTLDEKGECDHGIDALLETLDQMPKEQREQQALDFIQLWCDKQQRRLLLLMDSSDLLLANLSHSGKNKKVNAGASQLWRLRDVLQNNPCLFWLGGSYQPLEAEALYHDTFLDFFYNIELKPLTLNEMRESMQEMARVFGAGRALKGDKAVAEISRNFDKYPERLNILHRLTGGNLRTTAMLYELFAAGGKNNVHVDLKRLLDLMTPLYKARIEVLADQPRKILAHLFEHWAPVSLGQLADISGLEKSSLSPQLKRLEQEGMIEKTKLPGTKSKGYQVTERFFNIWYLMRNAPRRLRLHLNYLIKFMSLWYSVDELNQLASQQNQQHHNHKGTSMSDYEYSLALVATLPEQNATKHQLEWTVFRQMRQQLQNKLGDLFDLQGDDKPFATSDDYLQRLEALPEKLRICSFEVTEEELTVWVKRVLEALTLSLEEKEHVAKGTQILSRFQFEELNRMSVVEAKEFSKNFGVEPYEMVKTAVYQGNFFPDCPDSELAYSQLVSCFSNDSKAFRLALSLFKTKHHDHWVEKAYRYVLDSQPEEYELWNDFGVFLSKYSNRYKEAEQAYRQTIKYQPTLANPWINLGVLLSDHLNRYEESELAFRQAIKLDPELTVSWYGLGRLLSTYLNKHEEAELAYHQSIKLDSSFVYPWIGLGDLLSNHLNLYKEAEKAYRQAIKIDPESVMSWFGLGRLLSMYLKQYEEAEHAYQQSIRFDSKFTYSWIGLGDLFSNHLNRYEEAEQAYRQAIKLDSEIANTWNNLGSLLVDKLHRDNDAEQAFRQCLKIDENFVYGYENLARTLIAQNKNDKEIISLYRAAIDKATKDDFNLLLQAHLYLGNQDLALQALNNLAENADKGDSRSFYQIKEQCVECYALGLGEQLAEIMTNSTFSDFLQPFILALQVADKNNGAILAAPVEIADMARDVLQEIQKKL